MIDAATANPSVAPLPVGTGPFIYSQWQPNDHFTATRNPSYWRSGLPYLDSITFRPIPDTGQRESTLRSGGVDMIESVTPTTITNFSGSGGTGYQLIDTRTGVIGQPTFSFIMLNTAVAPTNDLSIRQALAKGMDQMELQKLLGGPPAKPVERDLPAQLALLQQDGLSELRPVGGQEPGQPVQGPARHPGHHHHHHPGSDRPQGGGGRPADVGAGRLRGEHHRGAAGHHHRRLRPGHVPGRHLVPVRGGQPRSQLRVVEHHHRGTAWARSV